MVVSAVEEAETLELQQLLEGMFQVYGYDFRDYAPASLRRRIRKSVRDEKLDTLAAFRQRILADRACMERFLLNISIDVTAMFRDPGFFRTLRSRVIPPLRALPFIRIWDAGCSTGQEVYSIAILLKEEGLYDKTRIYATDMNEAVLKKARAGIFSLDAVQQYTSLYQAAGGSQPFSHYYTARYGSAMLDPALQKKVVWAVHNLVTDASFNEFHLIVCRNVTIYFNRSLQNRVHQLFYDSLAIGGVLGLGSRESLRFTPREECYEVLDKEEKLYRKVK